MTNCVDPINKVIIWSFPSGRAGETPDTVIMYNWALDRWSYGEITIDMLFRGRSQAVSPDSWDAVYGSPDSMTISPDSRVFLGGSLVLSAFSANKKMAFFNGDTLEATITTKEFGDENGGMVFATGVRPLIEGSSANASVSLSYKNDQTGTMTTGSYTSRGVTGICPQRKMARYFRANVKIPAASSWSHAVGVEPFFTVGGDR